MTKCNYMTFDNINNAIGNLDNKKRNILLLCLIAVTITILTPLLSMAVSAPAVTDFGYKIYDLVVIKGIQGPIGFVGGIIAIVVGAVTLLQQKLLWAISGIVSGGVLLGANDIVKSFGATF